MIRFALALMLAAPALAQEPVAQGAPNASFAPAFDDQTRAPALAPTPVTVTPFATGLAHPWGIAALPDGSYLVTERPGRMRRVAADGTVSAPLTGLPEISAERQGGLLDVAIAPDFAATRTLYFTYAKPVRGGTITAAARATLSADGTAIEDVTDIFGQEPPSASPMHYGSRIVPAPDGTLFITTGERSTRSERVLAQDVTTTYGKVIRITPQGAPAPGNPFIGSSAIPTIWSYGHRNPQGATIGPDGALWTIEHGPAGGDELNRPEAGGNYGWPIISYGVNYNRTSVGSGEAVRDGMEQPLYYWDPVIAPGGIAFHNGAGFDWGGDLLIGSLNPGGLVRLALDGTRVTGEERLVPELGRIRDVEVLANGDVLLLVDAQQGGIVRLTPG